MCFFADLQGLTLNLDTIDFLKLRNKDGKVSFMIYNSVFWNFYHEVNQKKKSASYVVDFFICFVNDQRFSHWNLYVLLFYT